MIRYKQQTSDVITMDSLIFISSENSQMSSPSVLSSTKTHPTKTGKDSIS